MSRWRGVIAGGLDIAAYTLLRTDRDGWTELRTNDAQLWVEEEKQVT